MITEENAVWIIAMIIFALLTIGAGVAGWARAKFEDVFDWWLDDEDTCSR